MSSSIIYPEYSNQPNFVGYPIYYIVDHHECWCASCINEDLYDKKKMTGTAVNYDDPYLYCSQCSKAIQAAYKDAKGDINGKI